MAEPTFALADEVVKTREGVPGELLFAVVGGFVFFVGAGAAYWVYVMQKGKPAEEFAEKAPGLYQLVYEKWRIDELYENTVIAAVDALADTAATFDQWFIDGIIARLTSAIVVASGTVLRALQTGVVHAYAAVMVLGVGAMGWFFMWQPHTDTTMREANDGKVLIEATPGLGYEFRWHSKSPDKADYEDWTLMKSVEIDVPAGETKLVRLEVKNAFGRTATRDIEVTRPGGAQKSAAAAGGAGVEVKRMGMP